MKIRRNIKRSVTASTDKDYASLKGVDFRKARDILTKDGYHEHEYGDKDDNNGYAVYRKGNKEVELTYEWISGKRKGEAHAGKVNDVYVDDDINATCSSKKSVKAGYAPGKILWVLDSDNVWKAWGSAGPKIQNMSNEELLESLNANGNEYIDVLITNNGENPDEYGRTEPAKHKFVKASEDYSSENADVIAVLEANGFEYANEPTPWWDKYMWLGFGATYNDETKEAYVWWNPNGNMVELPFNYNITSVADANALCDDLYTWDEYDIGDLLNAGLPLIGATSHENRLDEWDYDNGMGDVAYINTTMGSGTVTDAWGETTEYHNLQDLLEAAGIIR